MTPADSQVRVRVYQLDEAATWSDKGGVLHLNVASEAEVNRLILDCVVQKGEVYQQQEGTFTPATGSIFNGSLRFICYDMMWLTVSVKLLPTLIVWTEPTGEDFALSFEEQEGCQSIL
ncbi:Platinum sensitivity protein [Coemansia sp. RSA 1938]|nr:Platinum sensitivity protein [Coemansia sp. RSA 1938]